MQSCNNDDVEGAPLITNVRFLNPDSASISLKEALPGSLVVIQGQNLGSVKKVYFNDMEASFNAALGSANNIVIEIPGAAPTKAEDPNVPNKIKVITGGGEVTYDFVVTSPKPVLSALYSEFVKPNGTVIIQGNYFYNIKSVKLGSTNLDILSATLTEIKAKMPATAAIDYLTLEGEFGTAKTSFKMNDTLTGRMVNFDTPATSWGQLVCWGAAPVIKATDPQSLSGQFSRIKGKALPKTGYNDAWLFSTCTFDFKLPAGSISDFNFKFEHNVVENWSTGQYIIQIKADGKDYSYVFKPWNSTEYPAGYKTNGWKTAVIDLGEIKDAAGSSIADVSKITDLRVDFATPDAGIDSFDGSVDNFRIVKK